MCIQVVNLDKRFVMHKANVLAAFSPTNDNLQTRSYSSGKCQ